jgi:tripeptidyl-peptidase I
MKFFTLHLALLGVVALGTLAKPVVPTTHTLHERVGQHWGRGWNNKKRLPRDAMLPMRIGLKQSNEDLGRERLADMYVSTHF